MTHALEWPSLTVEWLPDPIKHQDKEISVHKMLLGTHTSSGEPNYLMVAEVVTSYFSTLYIDIQRLR